MRPNKGSNSRVALTDLSAVARLYDRLAKEALMQALGRASRDLVPERELASDAQRLDLWCVPDPERLDSLEPFGLLRRIAEQGPCAFEFFHQGAVTRRNRE